MGAQGRAFSEMQIRRIIDLLASTDTAMPDIATRMGCTSAAINRINREYGVRRYAGRSTWTVTMPREPE
jgi:hypothetical protein